MTTPRFVLHHRRSRITRKPYWWFTLVDGGNNKVVATSESYTSEAGARNGIQAVRDAAPNAEVIEK